MHLIVYLLALVNKQVTVSKFPNLVSLIVEFYRISSVS